MKSELIAVKKYLQPGDIKAIAAENKVSTATIYNVFKGKSTNHRVSLAILSKAAQRKKTDEEIKRLTQSLQA